MFKVTTRKQLTLVILAFIFVLSCIFLVCPKFWEGLVHFLGYEIWSPIVIHVGLSGDLEQTLLPDVDLSAAEITPIILTSLYLIH